jgi:gas vesicle protein
MVDKTLDEQMDVIELNQKLREAEEAQAEIDSALSIQEKARSLDSLRKQKSQFEAVKSAETTLEAVSEQSKARLERVQEAVAQWREDFSRALYEVEELIKTLPAIESEIFSAGHALRQASETLYYDKNPGKVGMGDNNADSNDIPMSMSAASGFENEWAQAGGLSPDLAVFPKLSGVAADLSMIIQKRSKATIYNPKFGTRFFRHH